MTTSTSSKFLRANLSDHDLHQWVTLSERASEYFRAAGALEALVEDAGRELSAARLAESDAMTSYHRKRNDAAQAEAFRILSKARSARRVAEEKRSALYGAHGQLFDKMERAKERRDALALRAMQERSAD